MFEDLPMYQNTYFMSYLVINGWDMISCPFWTKPQLKPVHLFWRIAVDQDLFIP